MEDAQEIITLKKRESELSHFILSNYKCLPMCQCESPTYIGTVTPHICGSCKKLIGHSGMCDCGFGNKDVRDNLINIILKVAMQHHDNISKSDEDAADEILKQHPELLFPLISKNQDGLCYYCNKMTSSIAGNPSEWPLMFCHSDEPGKVKHHHTGCVTQLLNQRGIDKILLHWCFNQFDRISGCHMDCNCTDEEHEMVKLAEEGKRKIHNDTDIIK